MRGRGRGCAGAAALALTLAAALAGCRGDEPPAEVTRAQAVLQGERGVIRVAGSGGMTPLARELGAAFRSAWPGAPRVVVEDSIGSGGGIRATVDGAVDVGLITRRLNERESHQPLVVIPVGRDAVIFAAHPDVAVDGVTSAELVGIFNGQIRTFSDGNPVMPLLRDRGESANIAVDNGIPGMAEARERAMRLGFRMLYHDDSMSAALAVTPGAIGVHSLGLLRDTRIPLKVLKLDGRAPTLRTLSDRSWPMVRPLALVVRADRVDFVRPFLRFAVSPEAIPVIEGSGCSAEPVGGAGSRDPIPAAEYGPPGKPAP